MRKVLTTIFICLFCSATVLAATVADASMYSYGLRFNAAFDDPDIRTGLDLSYEESFSLKNGFELDFDVRNDFSIGHFGYVFRIVLGNNVNIDLELGPLKGESSVVLQENHVLVDRIHFLDVMSGVDEDWTHVNIKAIPKKGITVRIADEEASISYQLSKMEETRIMFGRNTLPGFELSDVAPIELKDIVISNEEDTPLYVWKMMKHNGNLVIDALHNRVAKSSYGDWMMDSYAFWERISSTEINDKNVQVALDRRNQRVFIASPFTTTTVQLPNAEKATAALKGNGMPILDCGNQMIYDEAKDRLICFSRITDEITCYDFAKNTWSKKFWEEWPQMYHSSIIVDQEKRQMISFGGYGNHVYNSDLLIRDLDTWSCKRYSLAGSIGPRYLASFGTVGDSLIVIGGYGTVTGQQVDSPYPYRDIVAFNKSTKEISQIGSIPVQLPQVAFSSTMLTTADEKEVFALGFDNRKYNAPISLVSYNLETQEMRTYGNEIPFKFHDVESYVDLMFSADSSAIYAVVRNAKPNDGAVSCEIWSISYPPISPDYLVQAVEKKGRKYLIWIFIVLAIIVAGILSTYFSVRGLVRKNTLNKYLEGQNSTPEQYEISLLGGIQLINSNGQDITTNVRPIVRSMLAFCIFGEANNNKGTSAESLENAFWAGMDKVSAANNRNVNIRKLRLCLEEFGEASLVYSNGIFHLNLGNNVKCDYIEIMSLLNKAKFKTIADKELLGKILDIANRGQLIPEISEPWLDAFKDAYVSKLLKVLDTARNNSILAEDSILMLRLADAILIQDSIDEDAIELKCKIYKSLGRHGYAQQVYNNYKQEYIRLMGEAPEKSRK